MKSTLIINSKPPYSSLSAKESQDTSLAFAAFGVPIALLFVGDGIYQLLNNQQPAPGQKNTAAAVDSYSLYEIDELYVSEADLMNRGLSLGDLVGNPKAINNAEMKALLARFDNLLTY